MVGLVVRSIVAVLGGLFFVLGTVLVVPYFTSSQTLLVLVYGAICQVLGVLMVGFAELSRWLERLARAGRDRGS